MKSGDLRHRVSIQKYTEAKDGQGGFTKTWSEYLNVYAKVEPLNGRERWIADQLTGDVNYRVTIRYQQGIIPSMRVVFGSKTFNIRAVIDKEERHIELQLMCEELRA